MKTNELLRRYVDDRSEPAFEELVRQHVDLVYSAALRQVNGNAAVAQDVTQAVFTDLARKAPRLTQHAWLPGWLYTSTRYLAAKAIRAEQTRRSHEQEAHAMNQIFQTPEPDTTWQELRPLLDAAMHDLSAADREAVLMRYFERLSLAEIGARLGLKANAANMRIDRAVDRLRAALAKRGVTSTLGALAATLTARAVGTAPAGLATRASTNALAAAATTGGLSWALFKLAGLMQGKTFLAASAAVLVIGLAVLPKWLSTGTNSTSSAPSLSAETNPPASVVTVGQRAERSTSSDAGGATEGITLQIVADDTGKPVPGAGIEYFVFNKGARRSQEPTLLTATEEGRCIVPVSCEEASWLRIDSRTDGYADISAVWAPEQGEKIPPQYTLRLVRSVPIGGQVLDDAGQPVAGAEVQAITVSMTAAERAASQSPQPPHLYTQTREKTVADAKGRWHLDRFASASVPMIESWATHPGYFTEPLILPVSGNPEAAKQLEADNYVFKLTRGISAQGMVVDSGGHPVAGAKVTAIAEIERAPLMAGQSVVLERMDHIETTNRGDGSFTLTGCRPGTNHIEVEAPGFALVNEQWILANDPELMRFVLQPGHVLRLRLLDAKGMPVTNNGSVYPMVLEPGRMGARGSAGRVGFGGGRGRGGPDLLLEQMRVLRPDAEGRVAWESAPEETLQVSFQATGVDPTNILVPADGQEHTVTLAPTGPPVTHFIVTASVHDAASGQPIAHFSVARGSVSSPSRDNPSRFGGWASADGFQGGKYLFEVSDGHRGFQGASVPATRFKFFADGYAPFITRDISQDESNVQLDIALAPRPSTAVTILTPDGQPAANADVGLEMPGVGLAPVSGGLRHTARGNYTNVFSTDENGRFALPPDDEITRVVAASPAGYAETTPAMLAMNPVLRLQPWGRITGTMISGGKPVVGRKISVGVLDVTGTTTTGISTETDAEGRFDFAKVPPGQFTLWQRGPGGPSRLGVPSVQVRSGDTTFVSAQLYTITAHASLPANVAMPANSSLSLYVDQPQLKAGLRMSATLKQTSDGTWMTEDFPAGDYTLSATVVDMATVKNSIVRGMPLTTLMRASATFTIPANPPSGVLDLGEIVLQPVP